MNWRAAGGYFYCGLVGKWKIWLHCNRWISNTAGERNAAYSGGRTYSPSPTAPHSPIRRSSALTDSRSAPASPPSLSGPGGEFYILFVLSRFVLARDRRYSSMHIFMLREPNNLSINKEKTYALQLVTPPLSVSRVLRRQQQGFVRTTHEE